MRTAGSKRILNILVGSQGIEPILDHFLASYTKIVDMGSLNHQNWHQQICYSAVRETKSPVAVSDATEAERRRDEATYKQVDQSTPQLGIVPSEQDISVYPILSDRGCLMRLQEFHEALTKAIVNIVERWWDDTTADFPSRMPLEPRAEEILRWVAEPSKKGSMSAFADCLGNWRPDFLLTHNDLSVSSAGFQICEINSRTPYNALLHTAYKHAIMKEVIGSDSVIEPAGDFQTMIDGLFDHFDLDLPIHLVRGRDNLEREEFALFAEQKTGLRPRLVHFADLELRADDYAPDGLAVYCRVQGQQALERVHQVALALFPEEYSVLSPDMLRHLARISVNDLRTSLLVNDQRLLGIVLQELDDLVQKHGILTPDQAKAVQEGVVPTILPGSPELERIIHEGDQKKTLKSNYMFKAARESRGNGHLLGEELSIEEWEAALHGMQDPSIHADKTSYVLQPFVRQPKFDIMTDSNRAVRNSQVVGTYYTVNGRCVGLGPWRSGNGKICNVYGGGCVLVNSVTSKLA